ncbi:hypothetical protein [Hyphomonas jannaschiana]|uniref:Uncharacterized protein n=1 Tax=Hyphomonas jannaschiana VP2 TaxID=1280952 RepID=A0A059FF92_9PROT|nr:hypothetical protein [Hyphomonas jannaschiana]KCZ89168.1 hypothetical protein HJA_07722 [Hyphomonas jannaschiana VP2]
MAYSQHTLYGGALVGIIVAACVAGIAITGGPGEARKEKEDRARATAMAGTAVALACYYQEFGDIPEDLTIVEAELSKAASPAKQTNVCAMADIQKDPISDEYFRLKREAGEVTHICGDFATAFHDSGNYLVYSSRYVVPDLGEARETPGEHCYELNLSAKMEY